MTISPSVRIDLVTGVGVAGDDFLTLDDPVRGEIDEALYPLFDAAPDLITDVATGAFAYSIRRGRSDERDEIDAGTLAVDLRNYDGTYQFDVTGLEPARRVRVFLDEIPVYDGVTEDWRHSYDTPAAGDASVSFTAVDALGELATKTIPSTYVPVVETAGDRLESATGSQSVEFPTSRTGFDDGATELQADNPGAGQNALNYAQLVARSEMASFFASRTGILTMRDRYNVIYDAVAAFSDDGSGIPFTAIEPSRASEFLYNRVSITREGGTEQIAETATTQGVRTLTYSGLLMNSDTDALHMAETLLALYSSLVVRVSSLTINLSGITDTQRATCLNLELGDPVTIDWTPPGTVTPVAFAANVEGIEIGGAYNSTHLMVLRLSPAEYVPFPFILDSATDGVLDTDIVYY